MFVDFAHRPGIIRRVLVCQVKTKCQGKEVVVEKSILTAYEVHSLLIMVYLFPSIISFT